MPITPTQSSGLAPSQINRLKQQAEDLEGVFLNILTKEMFATAKPENGFGGGFGEETWRSMQAEQLANTMAQNGGLGLADHLLRDMIALQEATQGSPQNLPQNTPPSSRDKGVFR